MTDTTPTDPAAGALEQASGEALLRAFAALTHRIHDADQAARSLAAAGFPVGTIRREALRAQRDRIQAEVLRRMEDTP